MRSLVTGVYIVALAIYLAAVAAGGYIVGRREAPAPTDLVANRELRPNSLVLPGDVRPPGVPAPTRLDGRYVRPGQTIAAGEATPDARFVATPELFPGERHMLLALPLPDRVNPKDANAGQSVQVCHGSLRERVSARVLALRCEGGRPCVAVLDLSPDLAREIAPALGSLQEANICPP